MLAILCLCFLVSYLIGSFPFGLWVGLLWKQVDIRTLGSQNIGATNVLRVLGPGPGLTVFALDTAKGAAGIVLAHLFLPHNAPFYQFMLIGFLAIAGHTFSPFLRFKGGKGVATSLGVLLALSLPVGLIGLGIWIALVAITRYVSLASIVAACTLPVTSLLCTGLSERRWMFGLAVMLAVLVTVKHRANIQRLLHGAESKIGQRVQVPAEPILPAEPRQEAEAR